MTPREWPDQNWMRAQDLAGSFTDDKLLNVGKLADAIAAAEERGRRAGIEERDALRAALGVLLDSVDYTSGACTVTEMVGAVLPMVVIVRARAALAPRGSGKENT